MGLYPVTIRCLQLVHCHMGPLSSRYCSKLGLKADVYVNDGGTAPALYAPAEHIMDPCNTPSMLLAEVWLLLRTWTNSSLLSCAPLHSYRPLATVKVLIIIALRMIDITPNLTLSAVRPSGFRRERGSANEVTESRISHDTKVCLCNSWILKKQLE